MALSNANGNGFLRNFHEVVEEYGREIFWSQEVASMISIIVKSHAARSVDLKAEIRGALSIIPFRLALCFLGGAAVPQLMDVDYRGIPFHVIF